ncbi:thiamine phosphate synthase [bacterium]|nr:thiamine phosphate synthase [bacterium]
MEDIYSPQAERLLEEAVKLAAESGHASVNVAALLAAIIDNEEGEAAKFLNQLSIDIKSVRCALLHPATSSDATMASPPWHADARHILARAQELALAYSRFEPVGSREILIALLEEPGELREHFTDVAESVESLIKSYHDERQPLAIAIDPELEWRAFGPPEATDISRIIDANLNRAREGFRVVEEYVRFVLDDARLSERLKQLRHQIRQIADCFPNDWLRSSRDTENDVGTSLTSASEIERRDIAAVVSANIKRCQESLRSIEEYAKIESESASKIAKSLRYEVYTIERLLRLDDDARRLIDESQLYWLCDPAACRYEFEWTVKEAIAGGVHAIQLRDKTSPDRHKLVHARQLRHWTREAGILFIMNDRPDIARLAEADGVHVGQEELSIRDVRRIVGPRRLVGLSTHSIEQARQALLHGADYIGVGPLFPSETKSFDRHVGLELVTQVASEISVPAFMIGGISLERLPSVQEAGGRRVAVSHAISSSDDPRETVVEFISQLNST